MSDSHRTYSETKAKQNEQRFYENLASKNAQLAKKFDANGHRITPKKGGDL